jgi:hypothetical protein
MSRFGNPEKDVDLLESVSRYFDLLTKPELFEEKRRFLDGRIAELRELSNRTAIEIASGRQQLELDKEQAVLQAQQLLDDAKAEAEVHRQKVLADLSTVSADIDKLMKNASDRAEKMVADAQLDASRIIAEAETHCANKLSLAQTKITEAEAKLAEACDMKERALKALKISEIE